MIVRSRAHWLRMLFVWRGSVIRLILPQLGTSTVIAVLVTLCDGRIFGLKIGLTAVPFTLLGIALAIFLGFRNTVSYERFWDARKLWGSLLNDGRSAARQVLSYSGADAQQKQEFVHGLIAFVYAVKHQLRATSPAADIEKLLPPAWQSRVASARFVPAMILLCLGERIGAWLRAQQLSPIQVAELDGSLSRLTDAFGGCERIASTPIPFAYSVLLHRTIYLYCFLLPFGLIDTIGDMTAVIVAFISYTFFALEALASEIEEPFGTEPNDLALDAMSISIEITLREMLGETSLPAPPLAKHYILS
jgi:putative membrane protein